ncbi:hypothetical protein NOMA109596_14855 [Nocardioides marinus]
MREDAGRALELDPGGDAVGDLVAVDGDLVGQVDDRLHDHLGAGNGEPFADGVGGEGLVVVLEAGEVEGEVAAAEVAQGLGTADVEGIGGAGGQQLVGDGADRCLELLGIGTVQQPGQVDTVGGPDRPSRRQVEVDVEAGAGVDLFHLSRLGVEACCRLRGQPLDGGEGGGVHHVGEMGVDERSGLGGQAAGEVGDAAYPPHLHLARFEAGPDLRQPVAGLHGIRQQHPPRVGGTAQCGGELDDRELADLGCTGAGELEHRVGAGHPEPGHPRVLGLVVGVVVGQPEGAVQVGQQLAGGVPVGPLGDRDEPVPVSLVSSLVEVANGSQQVTGRHRRRPLCRVILVPECHDQILLEHVFE